jgi:hypothetical protein
MSAAMDVTDISIDTTPIPALQPHRRRWRLRPISQAGSYSSIRGEEYEAFGKRWQMEVNPKGFNAQCADYWSFWLHILTPSEKIDTNYHLAFILHHPNGGDPLRHVAEIAEGQHSCWGFFQFLLREQIEDWVDTTDDSLTFEVEIADLRLKAVRELNVSPCSLATDFSSTLASGLFSDAVVKADGHDFAVHRSVLVSRSPVFRAMLTRGMEESKNGVINLSTTTRLNAALLLNFLYTGQLPGPLASSSDIVAGYKTLESVQDLFVLAHQYDLNRMTELVVPLFRMVITTENVLKVMKFAQAFPPSCTGAPLLNAFARSFAIDHAEEIMKAVVGQLPAPTSPLSPSSTLSPSVSAPAGLNLPHTSISASTASGSGSTSGSSGSGSGSSSSSQHGTQQPNQSSQTMA